MNASEPYEIAIQHSVPSGPTLADEYREMIKDNLLNEMKEASRLIDLDSSGSCVGGEKSNNQSCAKATTNTESPLEPIVVTPILKTQPRSESLQGAGTS